VEELQLNIVWPHQVEALWPQIGPWVVLAIGEAADHSDVEFIKRQCVCGNAVPFVLSRNNSIEVVLICETAFYGGRKTLVLRWLCGKERHNWLCYIHLVEDYAYANNFERLELWGRKAWERELKGYGFAHEFTVLGKYVTKRVH